MSRVTTKQALAARKSWQERAETWREKIETAKIIGRFQEFLMGMIAPKGWVVLPQEPSSAMLQAAGISELAYQDMLNAAPDPCPVTMTPAQVKAGQVLLDRVMPTLSASEIVKKDETFKPEQLLQMLRERYGDDVANAIAKNYTPTHEQPETPQ